ncbi:hypothetical protein RUM43_009897 [Polyplax serrata]|uniref:Uncharacterized protein n=1 Tax=Polyplax serrata TaxID=468196 RepID=A0AAN8P6S7_POLSC
MTTTCMNEEDVASGLVHGKAVTARALSKNLIEGKAQARQYGVRNLPRDTSEIQPLKDSPDLAWKFENPVSDCSTGE